MSRTVIDAGRDYPRIVVTPPGPKARAIVERQDRWASTSYRKEYPLVVARGERAIVEDVDGNRFLDFMGGIAVAATGHAHPKVVRAIQEAASRFLHICGSDFYYDGFAALCERLARLAPGSSKKRVFLTNSGTEAVEGAIKLTEDDLFVKKVDPQDVAAIFVEPIQGEGGYIVPPPGYLKALRELCDRHGILLVCDEVQTGIGRTGTMFACEYDGVEPDVLLVSKGLASGMPVGGIIAKESVMRWQPGTHGSTFGGNPVCCAAALATLDLVEHELLPGVTTMGERLFAGLRRLQERYPSIGDVRGRGLMIGVEFVEGRDTREPAPAIPQDLVERAFKKGLLLLGAGRSTLRLAPPLVIDEYDVDTALRIIEECLREMAD